jgi:hypothetical protein
MRTGNLDRRLDAANGLLCEHAYEQFTRLFSIGDRMTAADLDDAAGIFRLITDLEAERGTPAQAMLDRFPREFEVALQAEARRILDARKQGRKRQRTSP